MFGQHNVLVLVLPLFWTVLVSQMAQHCLEHPATMVIRALGTTAGPWIVCVLGRSSIAWASLEGLPFQGHRAMTVTR